MAAEPRLKPVAQVLADALRVAMKDSAIFTGLGRMPLLIDDYAQRMLFALDREGYRIVEATDPAHVLTYSPERGGYGLRLRHPDDCGAVDTPAGCPIAKAAVLLLDADPPVGTFEGTLDPDGKLILNPRYAATPKT